MAVGKSPAASKVIRSTTDFVHIGSRQDQHYPTAFDKLYYKRLRKPEILFFKTIPSLINNQANLLKLFNLKGIGYGQWVNNESRFNYLAASIIAIYDLEKVLKIGHNFGLNGTLALSIGARGKGKALAHFEPSTFIINITRYKDGDEILSSGGVGALAHEYGHALDFYIGYFYEPVVSGLNLPLSVNGKGTAFTNLPARQNMIALLEYIRTKTDLINRLRRMDAKPYWYKNEELFARVFEQYIQHKLNQQGITNTMLAQTKYVTPVYLTKKELAGAIPYIDKVMNIVRKYIAK